jgi:hypothetical protein
MFWILSIFIFLITISVLRATIIDEYRIKNYSHTLSTSEYLGGHRVQVPIWAYLIILILSFIPILNIFLFILFLILHIAWCYNNTKDKKYCRITILSLSDDTLIGKVIHKINRFLNKTI